MDVDFGLEIELCDAAVTWWREEAEPGRIG